MRETISALVGNSFLCCSVFSANLRFKLFENRSTIKKICFENCNNGQFREKKSFCSFFRTSFIPFLDDDCSTKSTPTSFHSMFWVCYDSFFPLVATTDSMQFINLFSLRLPLCCSRVHLKLAGFKQQLRKSDITDGKQLWISRPDKSLAYLWNNQSQVFLEVWRITIVLSMRNFSYIQIVSDFHGSKTQTGFTDREFHMKALWSMKALVTSV